VKSTAGVTLESVQSEAEHSTRSGRAPKRRRAGAGREEGVKHPTVPEDAPEGVPEGVVEAQGEQQRGPGGEGAPQIPEELLSLAPRRTGAHRHLWQWTWALCSRLYSRVPSQAPWPPTPGSWRQGKQRKLVSRANTFALGISLGLAGWSLTRGSRGLLPHRCCSLCSRGEGSGCVTLSCSASRG